MRLTDKQREFLEEHHSAGMITLRPDGTPHTVRVAVGLVDGKIWSSGTKDRLRTAHLRRDPRSTLFVFDSTWRWLTLESTVTLLDGPSVPEKSLRLFQTMQQRMQPAPAAGHIMWSGQERPIEEFLRLMVQEQRLIYEFEVTRAYGMP